MKFAGFESRLVLTQDPAAERQRVAVLESVSAAITEWQPLTRISPLFGVEDALVQSPASYTFRGAKHIVFLGPVRPDLAIAQCSERSVVWLTLGLFNVVVVAATSREADKLRSWATGHDVPWERWRTSNGLVDSVEYGGHQEGTQTEDWRDGLAGLASSQYGEELQDAVHEYCSLMASSIARSTASTKRLTEDLIRLSAAVAGIIRGSGPSPNEGRYVALGQMLTVNAGLSRFSSQTFAGTSPIRQTECHYWTHSLLGVGVATLALRNLVRFIESTLGEARLPVRFELLRNVTQNVPDLTKADMPTDDHLGNVVVPGDRTQPLVPLLPYFSARDGYRSTEFSISAPLSVICSCRSRNWSLTTLTHEISHVVVRAILAHLLPNLHDDSELDACFSLLEQRAPGRSVFDEIRRIVLFAIVMMDNTASGRTGAANVSKPGLRHLIQKWRQEVDEIMVHVFDYMYFYGRDTDQYVAGIWASWGTIPNVRSRVKEYVTRTVSAVLVHHLRRGCQAEEVARAQVQEALRKLASSGQGGRYVSEAIDYLQNEWESDIRGRVAARRQLVKIVASYLFSERIATAVRAEVEVSGGTGEREGYTLRVRELDAKAISNPLRFIEIYTVASEASAIESAWMLYILAFGIRPDGQ
jgi:hypothetical protein